MGDLRDRIGFYAALVIHALVFLGLAERELTLGVYLPALPGNEAGKSQSLILEQWLTRDEARAEEESPRVSRFGEAEGHGYAINSAPGKDLLYAPEGDQDQAWLSRDPEGPGPLPEEPSFSTVLPGNGGGGASGQGGKKALPAPMVEAGAAGAVLVGPVIVSPGAPRVVPKLPAHLVRIEPEREAPAMIAIEEPATRPVEPVGEKAVLAVAVPVVPPELVSRPGSVGVEAAAAPASGEGRRPGRPGPNVPAADPAPQADSESDAFSRIGSVTFKPGRVDARLGREHKLVKPRLTVKGQLDVISIVNPSVILKVSLDGTGKVTDVEVLKSSGSNEIDLPVRLAMFKSWIEPRKGRDGQGIPDVIPIVINYR